MARPTRAPSFGSSHAYTRFAANPVTRALGAGIDGVGPFRDLDDTTIAELRSGT